jgi:hypothetical protein
VLEAKKPQFIRKSDFINYFTRSRDQWFFSETQLIDYIQSKIKKDFDVHEENDDYEYDYLDALRTAILNNETIDQRDPKVYEGTLIDKKSREYIKLKYIRLNAYDFDEIYKGIYDFKYLANETKKFLQKDNFILFQPVFIYRDKAVTRPDVLIKKNGEYTIMEVKSTTRPKSKHLVDLIYQHHVINDVLKIYDAQINDYLLCVVKYIKGVKNHIDFVITNRIPLVKGGKNLSEKRKRQFPGKLKYSDEAIEAQRLARLNNDSNVTIQNLMQLNVKELEIRKKQIYNEYVVPLLDTDYFDKIINELSHDIPVGEPSLEPD